MQDSYFYGIKSPANCHLVLECLHVPEQLFLHDPEHVYRQLVQEFLHVPEHVYLHPPEQELEHDPAHPPEQPYLHPIGLSSLAATIEGTLANMIAPKIGNAPLAAFLKNSLRD